MVHKFIQGAIKRKGALRAKLGAGTHKGPRGGTIKEPLSMNKVKSLVNKLHAKSQRGKLSSSELRTLKQANLAMTLKKLHK